MISHGQLLSLIRTLDPYKNPARLAFSQYLSAFTDLESEFTPETLDRFYDRCMTIQHWQLHRKELAHTVREDLAVISKKHYLGLEKLGLLHADEVQWLKLENLSDFEALLSREQAVLELQSEVVKVAPLNEDEILRMRLLPNHDLIVEVKPRMAFLNQGQLHLLRPTTRLSYDSDYELKSDTLQVVDLSHDRIAVFKVSGLRISGFIVQGPQFVRAENLSGSLKDHWKLVQAIKKLESHFINPTSDSDYLDLVEQLKKAIQVLKSQHPQAQEIAQELHSRGQIALRDLFPNDKLLFNLVMTLRRTMTGTMTGTMTSSTTQGTPEKWQSPPLRKEPRQPSV